MKFLPVGAELFRADGQTERHEEANSRFSQFCECAWVHEYNHHICSNIHQSSSHFLFVLSPLPKFMYKTWQHLSLCQPFFTTMYSSSRKWL